MRDSGHAVEPASLRLRWGSVRLTLQLPANRANAREHWAATHGHRRAYKEQAYLDLYHQLGPPRQVKNRIDPAIVTATLYVWSIMDDDNAVARLKWPLDALVTFGILQDDRRPHCQLAGIPEQVIDRKRPRVELVIEEMVA